MWWGDRWGRGGGGVLSFLGDRHSSRKTFRLVHPLHKSPPRERERERGGGG